MAENPTAEMIAQGFHAAYEALAPAHGYETREASAVAWEDVPDDNRSLMVATVQRLLDTGAIAPGPAAASDAPRGEPVPKRSTELKQGDRVLYDIGQAEKGRFTLVVDPLVFPKSWVGEEVVAYGQAPDGTPYIMSMRYEDTFEVPGWTDEPEPGHPVEP